MIEKKRYIMILSVMYVFESLSNNIKAGGIENDTK